MVYRYLYVLCGSEPAVGRGREGERVEGAGVLPLHAHQVRHLLQGPEVRHVQANRLRQMLYQGMIWAALWFPDPDFGEREWFTNRFKEGKMERLLLLVF